MTPPLLRNALLAGVAYFCCMAVAHFFGIKQPLLFVYYDTPFYAYQDKIISFAVVAYIGLFHAASRHMVVVPTALIVLGMTVLGLSAVNMSDALASAMTPQNSLTPYWVQTGLIAGYFAVLVGLYLKARNQPS